MNFAEARSMAGHEDAPGLVVGAVDVNGAIEAFHGPANQRRSYPRLGNRPPPVLSGRPGWPHPGREVCFSRTRRSGSLPISDPMKSG